ncbi:exostosin family protein [Vicingus serpentipes]|uniref:Exostosin family protein n=1 Tax=Vicingus serpentipes TaxID=1926625 RepID=A0A5C6RSJ6_9FLAO|nr:exostosin family protein [Vicingus serpentipes]TXB65416.1 exostosin family protein [Vicingus serpentipes]
MSNILNLYTDLNYLPSGKNVTIMLYPFFDSPKEDINDPDYGRFENYINNSSKIFKLVNNENDADIVVLPFEFSFEESDIKIAQKFVNNYKKSNKPILVFYNSDYDYNIPLDNVIILRTSFYKSTKSKNEFALPGWSKDFYNSRFNETTKKPVNPSISYCGYIDYLRPSLKDILNNYKDKLTSKTYNIYEIGPKLRGKAIRNLIKSKGVKTNFIFRNGFWAAGLDKKMAREEYIQNMYSSDYALVVRGAGNFSYRLYEVLSCGKIPVFIDTDCVLPYDHIIDWKKYVVWINQKDNISQRLIEFHNDISDKDFYQLKQNCRKLYEEWISPFGFFSKLNNYLDFEKNN